MEKEDFETVQRAAVIRPPLMRQAFWVGVFLSCYVAILPMADTIALRNLSMLGLLLALSVSIHGLQFITQVPWLIGVWAIFVVLFPWFVSAEGVGFESYFGQWGRGLLSMVAGAGAAWVLRHTAYAKPWVLAVLSAVPIFVHLGLIVLGLLQTGQIPWGSWGRESHHADLGYAAGQTTLLAAAAYLSGTRKIRVMAVVLILACLVSTSIAHSRAGFAFTLLAFCLVFGAATLVSVSVKRLQYLLAACAMACLGLGILAVAVKNDPRWQTMSLELAAGFYGDALELECRGTQSIKSQVEHDFGDQAPRILASIEGGDAARIVLLRAGLQLAVQHPWGWDGTRQSFQKMLASECPTPAIRMAHTHNGWLDTWLALGVLGAGLYFSVLCLFLKRGLSALRQSLEINPWAYVLIAASLFWLVRGLTDSVFRDHMLEMQGFLLAFAYVASHTALNNSQKRPS